MSAYQAGHKHTQPTIQQAASHTTQPNTDRMTVPAITRNTPGNVISIFLLLFMFQLNMYCMYVLFAMSVMYVFCMIYASYIWNIYTYAGIYVCV